jgi:hypothetical protein
LRASGDLPLLAEKLTPAFQQTFNFFSGEEGLFLSCHTCPHL